MPQLSRLQPSTSPQPAPLPKTVRATTDEVDVEFLSCISPFSTLPPRLLELCSGLMRVQEVAEGETLFRAGDESDALYIVRTGEVEVYTDTVGEPVHLMARVRATEMFGEVGVLEGSRRNVSARAAVETEVVRLAAADLLRLGRASRPFSVQITQLAFLRYLEDSSTKLELGKRREARIRVDREVLLRPGDGEPLPVVLENLSIGGACLSGLPDDFHPSEATRVAILAPDETELVSGQARVAWRRGGETGLEFTRTFLNHEERVQEALRRLLWGDCGEAEVVLTDGKPAGLDH